MKLLTKDSDYATRALIHMAGDSKKMYSVTELVSELGIPKPFLRRILQKTSKAGLINSFKGKGGGFVLKKDPKSIKLFDIIKVFQESESILDCFFKGKVCPNRKTCPIRTEVLSIEKTIFDKLNRISVHDLMKGRKAL